MDFQVFHAAFASSFSQGLPINQRIFSELLQWHVEVNRLDGRKVIDATHIKVNQDACHSREDPEIQAFGKTKGGRNSKLTAVTNGKGKAPS